MDQILSSVCPKGTFINPSNVSLCINYSVFPYSYIRTVFILAFPFFFLPPSPLRQQALRAESL